MKVNLGSKNSPKDHKREYGARQGEDVVTGQKIRELKPVNSNNYAKNRATFDPSDELILNDGVIFDVRTGREVKKLDKLNQNLNGVFHPNGLEILRNSEVWDIRTFHLLKTVPELDQCEVKFTNNANIIYAFALEQETGKDSFQKKLFSIELFKKNRLRAFANYAS